MGLPQGLQREVTYDATSGGTVATPASFSPTMKQAVLITNPSYVTITVYNPLSQVPVEGQTKLDPVASGSGFIISPDGHVVTAGHVALKHNSEVKVRLNNGRVYEARVMDIDHNYDMAMLKLFGAESLQTVSPHDTPCLKRGATIFSLGRPGLGADTARLGRLSSMHFGQKVKYRGFGYPDAMVVRMNTRKGESGGPVFTESGKLAGMIVSTLSDGAGNYIGLANAMTLDSMGQFVCNNRAIHSIVKPDWQPGKTRPIKSDDRAKLHLFAKPATP